MNRIVKAFFVFIISLTICSCNNFLNDFVSSKQDGDYITVNFSISTSAENNSKAGMFIPDFSDLSSQVQKYVIEIYKQNEEDPYITKEVEAASPSVSVPLQNGVTYSVITKGIDSSSNVILKGETDFTPSESSSSFKLTVRPYQDESVYGNLSIIMALPATGKTYDLKVFADGMEKHNGGVTCDSAKAFLLALIENLSAGQHQIVIQITDIDSKKSVTVNPIALIYSGMTSSIYVDGSKKSNGITITQSQLTPASVSDYVFYVNGTDGTLTDSIVKTKSGKTKPVKCNSLADALNNLSSSAFDTACKTIYVSGKIEDEFSGGYGVSSNSIYAIGSSTKNLDITVEGYGSNCSLERKADTTAARLFEVASGSRLTLKNVDLSNGDAGSSGNGGAILNGGTVELSSVNISLCSAKYGGAIYCSPNSEMIYNGGTVSSCTASNSGGALATGVSENSGSIHLTNIHFTNNKATGTGSTGGAIYCSASTGLSFVMNGGSIKNNKSEKGNGGGATIYGNASNTSFTGVEISGNEAPAITNNNGQGGGLFVPQSGQVKLYDCYIHDNTAGNNGPDVCATGKVTVSGKTCIGNVYENASDTSAKLYVAAPIEPYTSGGKVATIRSNSEDTGTNGYNLIGTKVLDGDLSKEVLKLFALDKVSYTDDDTKTINLSGFVVSQSSSGTVTIENPEITVSASPVSITESSETTVSITVTVKYSETLTDTLTGASLSSCDIRLYYGSYEVKPADVSGFKISNGKITIPADMVNGTYSIVVSGKITGSTGTEYGYSDTISLEINR